MHPDADLQTGVAGDQHLDRELAVTAIEVAIAAEAYEPRFNSFETLDGHTALVSGETRHRQPGGRIDERHTVWLFTFEGDLLTRSRVFHSLSEALDYHSARADSSRH